MTKEQLLEWFKLTDDNRRNIFGEVANKMGLPAAAIEKDWWVVRTLQLIFQTEIAPHTVFKGGTSLSKAWNLIHRFSEDIDLALDRKFLGFDKEDAEMNGAQVSKLRKASCKYISEKYLPLLEKTFHDAGFTDVKLELSAIKSPDEDPVKIAISFPILTDKLEYVPPPVVIEIGSRSEKEPFSDTQFSSFVGEYFKGKNFADSLITIPTANPERTFLEKIFLLHEEFQQPVEKVKVERQTRHLYDLEKLMDTEFAQKALADKNLYQHIVEHRKIITPLRGIDYANHAPGQIDIIPPDKIFEEWRKDYAAMIENMIYGDAKEFDPLIERMKQLQERIKNVPIKV